MEKSYQSKFIDSLNGLRFFLFLFIFLHHIYLSIDYQLLYFPGVSSILRQFGNFAVTFFFILSGFCISLGYSDKFMNFDKDSILQFLKRRFIKIYPLYLLTGIICLIYIICTVGIQQLLVFPIYILMLQSWTTHITCAGNGAAWFIADIFFCYLLTPFVFYIKNHCKICKNNVILYFIILLLLIGISFILFFIKAPNSFYEYLYHFPILRFLQYLLGIILGYIYINNSAILNKINNIPNYILFIADSLLIILIHYVIYIKIGFADLIFIKTQILFIPLISISLLYISTVKKGIFNYIFTYPLICKLGSISFEAYLIHYVFITIFSSNLKNIQSFFDILWVTILILLLTIILSNLYKYMQNAVSTKWRFVA